MNRTRTTQHKRDDGALFSAAHRAPEVEACFDYDAIVALVEWNIPDHEHTRHQLVRCLSDLVETAIRERLERGL